MALDVAMLDWRGGSVERVLMCCVGLSTEFPRVKSAYMMIFDLVGVRTNNELAPLGVAWLFALEAGISWQLVLSRSTLPR